MSGMSMAMNRLASARLLVWITHERIHMTQFTVKNAVIALGLVFSSAVMAQAIAKDDYKAVKEQISADYKAAKLVCDSLSGNAKDICVKDAKGKSKVARAELEASYEPSRKHQYNVDEAKAEATYAVAREHCDDLSGNAKDICVKEAKSAETAAKADAKAKMKISNANAKASTQTADARSDASKTSSDARKDAATEKREADYRVAKEKCDTFAGAAKEYCLEQAKRNHPN